jgi:hypothetical protein
VTPEVGSLAAEGVEPTIVRVHVAEPAAVAPEPAATPTPDPTATPAPTATPEPTAKPASLPLTIASAAPSQ